MQYKNYHSKLGIDKNASWNDIKKACRKLAKKYHPCVNPGNKQAEEKFKDISEAYEVLSDPENREKYKNYGNEFDFHNEYDFDPSQLGAGKNVKYEPRTGEGMDQSDLFNMFFKGDGFDFDSFFYHAGVNKEGYKVCI